MEIDNLQFVLQPCCFVGEKLKDVSPTPHAYLHDSIGHSGMHAE